MDHAAWIEMVVEDGRYHYSEQLRKIGAIFIEVLYFGYCMIPFSSSLCSIELIS